MYHKVIESFSRFWDSVIDKLPDFLVGLLILVLFILLGNLFHKMFKRRIQTRLKDAIISSFLGELLKWTFYILGITFLLFNLGWGGIAGSLMAGAGVTAIILGFAFKDIAENLLSGVLLAINRPFIIGDIVEVNGIKGPVVSVDLRTTHIKTIDGRDIYVPNSMMVKNVFTNYTKDGFLRLDFVVGIDFNDDIEKARKLILDHLKRHKDIVTDPPANVALDELGESAIAVKVMFWTNLFNTAKKDQQLLGEPVKSRIMREVKDLLIDNGFTMPAQILELKMYNEQKPLKIRQE